MGAVPVPLGGRAGPRTQLKVGALRSNRFRTLRRLALTVLAVVVLFVGTGFVNDWNARRVHRHHNAIGADGIAERARTGELVRGGSTLVVLVHGFGATPQTYRGIAAAFEAETDVDLWVPLLAQHGRSLDDFRAFDPAAIRADFLERLNRRMEGYDRVVAVGHSFGGALLFDLMARGALPERVEPILFAPAVHVLGNDDINRLSLNAFALWASYCDVEEFGCVSPNPRMAGPTGTVELYQDNYFFTFIVRAILVLFDYADTLVGQGAAIQTPVNMVMARDDLRVDFPATVEMCAAMAACRMHALPLGSHNPQLSVARDALTDLLMRLVADPSAGCEGLDCTTL